MKLPIAHFSTVVILITSVTNSEMYMSVSRGIYMQELNYLDHSAFNASFLVRDITTRFASLPTIRLIS